MLNFTYPFVAATAAGEPPLTVSFTVSFTVTVPLTHLKADVSLVTLYVLLTAGAGVPSGTSITMTSLRTLVLVSALA